MRSFTLALFISLCGFAATAQTAATPAATATHKITKPKVVEAGCGSCIFHMKDKGCNLAVKIDDKTYFVDGASLDDLGDAHADDGMCNVARKAEVTGSVVNDRFVSTSFRLLPAEKKNHKD
ncbi:DUF6370 family protein [Ferruginibacter sp. HRS2-29]|uniref:DUF6370 family protein n=1 Tax=Ferruginibacter sp. HRS2-29 TaxID=2487334 RepID=UPI0020CEDEFF|nr:DUF6370 family protein [Ferruginibacter sp. HRS2-29]MCP9752639.1 hypothetical protein [Ferruginibacter sp. HRS2-29]